VGAELSAYASDSRVQQGLPRRSRTASIARFQLKLLSSDPATRASRRRLVIGVGVPRPGLSGTPDYKTFNLQDDRDQIWEATQGNERTFAGVYGLKRRLN